MKKSFWLGVGMVSIYLLGLGSWVQAATYNTSTGAAVLLRNNASVRAVGMGGAQTAVFTDEAGAQDFNPAALFANDAQEISAMYYRGLIDDMFGALYYDTTLGKELTAGAGLVFYDAGSFDWTNTNGTTSKVSAQRDFLATLTSSYKLQELVCGANLKFLYSTMIAKYSAFSAVVDLGALYELKALAKNLYIGAAFRNLGTPLKYIDSADALPMSALAGLSYQVYKDKDFSLMLAGDAGFDFKNNPNINLGTEIWVMSMVAVRGGYQVGKDLGALTLGLGVQTNNFALDYAFNLMQALNSVHRISLKYTLMPEAPEKPEQTVEDTTPAYQPFVETQPEGPVEKIKGQIVEIQKVGGRVSNVILDIGSDQKIKPGYKGVILDASNRPIAGLILRQVDPKLSLAEVIGLGRDIDNNVSAVIDRPLSK